MVVWNIKQTIMKDYNKFSPVNEWHAIAFASPHKITNVGYVKNVYLKPLVVGWIKMATYSLVIDNVNFVISS